jgi:hypothetical protein
MGARAALLSFAAGLPRDVLLGYPEPDVAASRALVEAAFPGREIAREADTILDAAIWPTMGSACAGVFGDAAVLTSEDLAVSQPSALTDLVVRLAPERRAYAVFMSSVVDWYAFAVWDRGRLIRSFSASRVLPGGAG